ncbi:F-box domain protein [Aspergillus affinis]|uniref:F-box domain protein n=1 Tax=Aspergillus affinis TaxID=1070780 RepID=UPI0022FF2E14|nr:uncharacterized protein KD926_002319 [Aspergillus affinis]KAI9043940.1 hypothetical protein KD926_002319 [Aspergillus affinis]
MNPKDSKPSFFMSLPTELHLLILNLLLFPDLIHLKLTCTYFHTLIPPLSHSALIDAENTDLAVFKDVFACRYCLRLRPRSEFADRMLHRRRGRYGRDAHNRFCVDCGLQPRVGRPRYCPGAQIVMQGISYVICLTCHDFRLGVRDSVGRSVKAECRDCLKKREVMEKDDQVGERVGAFFGGTEEGMVVRGGFVLQSWLLPRMAVSE